MRGKANAPIEVVEETKEVESKLNKAFFLMIRQCAKNLCRIIHVIPISYSARRQETRSTITEGKTHLLALKASSGALSRNATHCPDRRNSNARNACAMFSGRTN